MHVSIDAKCVKNTEQWPHNSFSTCCFCWFTSTPSGTFWDDVSVGNNWSIIVQAADWSPKLAGYNSCFFSQAVSSALTTGNCSGRTPAIMTRQAVGKCPRYIRKEIYTRTIENSDLFTTSVVIKAFSQTSDREMAQKHHLFPDSRLIKHICITHENMICAADNQWMNNIVLSDKTVTPLLRIPLVHEECTV